MVSIGTTGFKFVTALKGALMDGNVIAFLTALVQLLPTGGDSLNDVLSADPPRVDAASLFFSILQTVFPLLISILEGDDSKIFKDLTDLVLFGAAKIFESQGRQDVAMALMAIESGNKFELAAAIVNLVASYAAPPVREPVSIYDSTADKTAAPLPEPPMDQPTMKSATKVPHGIVSLAWDMSIDAWVGRHFSAAFIGTTAEHADAHATSGAEPEDRVMMFRQPIVTTGTRKSADNVQLTLLGFDLIGPMQIFPNMPTYGPGSAAAWAAANNARSRRRLQGESPTCGDDMELSADGERCDLKAGAEDSGFSMEDLPNGCKVFLVPLMEPITWKPFMTPAGIDGIEFKILIFPGLFLGGGITMHMILSLDLRAELCIAEMTIKATPIPNFTLRLLASIYLDIFILRGGIEVQADLLRVSLEPTLAIMLKSGFDAGAKIDLVLKPIVICIIAFVDYRWIKWCKLGFLKIPCGLTWNRLADFELACFHIGTGVRITLMELGTDGADKDGAPTGVVGCNEMSGGVGGSEWPDTSAGMSSVGDLRTEYGASGAGGSALFRRLAGPEGRRLSGSNGTVPRSLSPGIVHVDFSGFMDQESIVTAVDLDIGMHPGGKSGVQFLQRQLLGSPESWSGPLDIAPPNGAKLYACVTVWNGAGLSTFACGDALDYDSKPPNAGTLEVLDLHSGAFSSPNDCDNNVADRQLCSPFYVNSTTDITFRANMADTHGINTALWAVVRGQLAKPDSTFVSLPFGKELKSDVPDADPSQPPPPAPLPSPSPPVAREFSLICGEGMNSCEFSSDGTCDDGGQWSTYYECELNTDCFDCGPRANVTTDSALATTADAVAIATTKRAVATPPLEISTSKLQMVHGAVHYIHLALCDEGRNCQMEYSFPIVADITPPPKPDRVAGDFKLNTAADGRNYHFISPHVVRPAWNYPGGVERPTAVPLQDPESGDVQATWSLFEQLNGSIIPRLEDLPAEGDGYLPYGVKMYKPTLGASYLVRVDLRNAAGGHTITWSTPIVADWTVPVVTLPVVESAPQGNLTQHWDTAGDAERYSDILVRSHEFPPGASQYGGTRMFNWVSRRTTHVSVRYATTPDGVKLCSDPDSGIFATDLMLGTAHTLNDLDAFVRIGADDTSPNVSFPLTGALAKTLSTFGDYAECKGCSAPAYLSVRCLNMANMFRFSQSTVGVRVDGTPPLCVSWQVIAGHGLYKRAQVDTGMLEVSGFDGAIYDHETGILRVSYSLDDMTTNESLALPLLSHEGLSPKKLSLFVLNMLHGHRYRVTANAINGVGDATACSSSEVVVDTDPPVAGQALVLQQLDDYERHAGNPSWRGAAFQSSSRTLRLGQRGFADPQSGIAQFWVTVFRQQGNAPVQTIMEETIVPFRRNTVRLAMEVDWGQQRPSPSPRPLTRPCPSCLAPFRWISMWSSHPFPLTSSSFPPTPVLPCP